MSTRRIALTVLLASLLVAPVANAAPDWAPAVTFPVPSNAYGGLFEARYQTGGVATETFLEVQSLSPLQTVLHLGAVGPGGGYADQLTVSSGAETVPTGAQIAVAPNGAAVATWTELVGTNVATSPYRYRATYRPAGSGVWEAPTTLATDTERNESIYSYLTPVIGPDGTAAVGVQHIASKEKGAGKGQPLYRVDVAIHPAGGAWQAPVRISPESVSGESLALGLDNHGDLTAAYTLRISEAPIMTDDRVTAIVRRLPSSTKVWGPEEDITGSEITHSVYALHLGENEAGDAVLTYQYGEVSKAFDVWGVTRQGPNGSWTTPTQLVTGSSGPADAGVAPDGKAYILYWFQGNSSAESCEGVLRGPTGGTFSPQRCVSPPNQDTFSGSIAFLGNDAYFAWTGNVPGEQKNATVQGSRWVDSASLPEVARNLDLPGLPYGSPTLVNDQQGSVVAFFTNATNQTRAAAYDAGPPIALAAGVPASATVGQQVAFTSTFVDLWSGLGAGQPTWSFGDGTPAVGGANVTHAFSAPGSYTVTLTASDAFGNTTSSTYPIAIGASAGPSDTKPPVVTLSMPACSKKLSKKACKRRQASHSAWQTLTGQVTDPSPSSGIANVQVAMYSTKGKHVEGLTGSHFRKTTKAKARKAFATAKLNGSHWSLKLPKLNAGRYTILVRATDRAGHVSATISKTLTLK
jgi:PKD repeat protein